MGHGGHRILTQSALPAGWGWHPPGAASTPEAREANMRPHTVPGKERNMRFSGSGLQDGESGPRTKVQGVYTAAWEGPAAPTSPPAADAGMAPLGRDPTKVPWGLASISRMQAWGCLAFHVPWSPCFPEAVTPPGPHWELPLGDQECELYAGEQGPGTDIPSAPNRNCWGKGSPGLPPPSPCPGREQQCRHTSQSKNLERDPDPNTRRQTDGR